MKRWKRGRGERPWVRFPAQPPNARFFLSNLSETSLVLSRADARVRPGRSPDKVALSDHAEARTEEVPPGLPQKCERRREPKRYRLDYHESANVGATRRRAGSIPLSSARTATSERAPMTSNAGMTTRTRASDESYGTPCWTGTLARGRVVSARRRGRNARGAGRQGARGWRGACSGRGFHVHAR